MSVAVKDSLVFIKHVRDSIEEIESFVSGVSEEEFLKSKLIQNAVIRSIEVIGEAVKNLPMSFKDKYSDVPWNEIAGMRDKVIHHYFGVDLEKIWKVVCRDIPELKKSVENILRDE